MELQTVMDTSFRGYTRNGIRTSVSDHMTCTNVNGRLCVIGSLTRATMNQEGTTRTPGNEEAVLRLAEDNQSKTGIFQKVRNCMRHRFQARLTSSNQFRISFLV